MQRGYDLPDLAEILGRPEWMKDAACAEHQPELFFPKRGESLDPARAVCAGCLVVEECLAFSLQPVAGLPPNGVWAGTSERERRRLRSSSMGQAA